MALTPVGGVIALEGVQTGDGRLLAENAVTWADPPLPLSWLQVEMHSEPGDGIQIGIITELARSTGGEIRWTGFIDDEIPGGAEVLRRMEKGSAPFGNRYGISIDPDDHKVQLVAPHGEEEVVLASGSVRGGSAVFRLGGGTRPIIAAAGDKDTPDGEVLMEASSDQVIERVTRLRIRGATLCSVPAFSGAFCELMSAETITATSGYLQVTEMHIWDTGQIVDAEGEPVLAAGFPLAPPVEWFEYPNLSGPTPLTITDEGRVFGHIGTWNSCHDGFADRCVRLPEDADYEYFTRRGPVMRCREGCEIPVGTLTMDTGHHGATNHGATDAHYDNTGAAAAYVSAGTDEWGPWVAGCVRPDLSAEDVVRLRAAPPSVDIRPRDGRMELRAVLMVNVPGFPVERIAASAAPEDARLRRMEEHLAPALADALLAEIVPTT